MELVIRQELVCDEDQNSQNIASSQGVIRDHFIFLPNHVLAEILVFQAPERPPDNNRDSLDHKVRENRVKW